MTVDRAAALTVLAALAGALWHLGRQVELLRHEVTDKRIDDVAEVLHVWGREEREKLVAADIRHTFDVVRRARQAGGPV